MKNLERQTILEEPKQEKIQKVLQELNKTLINITNIPQMKQRELEAYEITNFQKEYLMKICEKINKQVHRITTLNNK